MDLPAANETSTLNQIITIVLTRLGWPVEASTMQPDTPIGEDGLGLDSLMVVELALDIEEQFGFEMDEDEMFDIGGMRLQDLASYVDIRSAQA